jgi:hypothetical protein
VSPASGVSVIRETALEPGARRFAMTNTPIARRNLTGWFRTPTTSDHATTQVTHFKTDRIFAFAWSRDGTMLALARGAVISDAVLITNER